MTRKLVRTGIGLPPVKELIGHEPLRELEGDAYERVWEGWLDVVGETGGCVALAGT
jgi:hypothetical protein